MSELTPAELDILWHSLGVTPEKRVPFRLHYVTCGESPLLSGLQVKGMMIRRRAPGFMARTDILWHVTEAGKVAALAALPEPPKLTRGQKRYLRFLNWQDSTGGTFREFLREDRGGEP